MAHIRFSPRIAAVVAAAVLGAAAVPTLAQPAPEAPATSQRAEAARHHNKMSPEQFRQARTRHVEAFKQKLQLTPEQEPAWTTFTESMKPQAHARLERKDLSQLTTPERIDHMRAVRAQRAAEADRRDEAVKTFYAALTPAQQKVFDSEGARMYRHGPKDKHMHGHHRKGEHRHHGQRPAPQPAPAAQ